MATRESIHALVEELEEADLEAAKLALVQLKGFHVSEEQRRELLERQAECDRGEVVDARTLLRTLTSATLE
ncbi:MAG: hypothetical protein GXP55_26440 [Deltaproteobacteria bacterium]|nr:hypothetical protein [Deltaproteobacteria bacterium]